ncbi:MAG: sigma-70 family RNA polymerase sigma factor [Lachnospiraceae bacterium]|nr:sigma-70 family RNA polymerase sigma factor [Lachnospiraceae bacterium]
MTNQEFELCITRIKNGEKGGLKDIYEAYLAYIFRVVYDILKSRENAEDITSDFFIKLWEKASSYRPGSGHKAFMTVMARNMAIDFLRKHKKEELSAMLNDLGLGSDEDFKQAPPGLNTFDKPTENEVVAEIFLQTALNSLEEAERQIVSMKILGELTFKEITEILNCPMGTITWRYQNAIKKLRRCGYE